MQTVASARGPGRRPGAAVWDRVFFALQAQLTPRPQTTAADCHATFTIFVVHIFELV